MLRFLGALLLLVGVVVGLGFYLGWFHIATDESDQKTNVRITMDRDKMNEDKEKAQEKVRDLGRKGQPGPAATEKSKEESREPEPAPGRSGGD